MDLDRKIGRLFSVPARGADLIRHIRENHVGGIIWFQSTSAEAERVTRELQAMSAWPLLVSADFESGVGMRFTDALWWPPAMAVAAAGDVALAEEQARATAREALALGVNHILAPVADVNVDPDNPVINTRSFGEDPRQVARFVAATVRGIQSEGAIATAKHFPGHGDTHVDSHRALPVLDVTRERLERIELVPFRAAIDAGVKSIMIGHLAVPALDPTPVPVRATFENVYGTHADEVPRTATMPATLSRPIVDLLRHDLGFQGLVVSDAMDMGGLAAHFDPGEAAVRAIEAGIDQILFSADTDAAIAAVKQAVRTGRITEARIDESVDRMAAAAVSVRRPSRAPLARDEALATEIATRSIKILRDTNALLPLREKHTAFVVTDFPEANPLTELEAARVIDATTEPFDITTDLLVLYLALRPKSGAGRIALPEAATQLAEKHAKHTIAISFGTPYVLRDLGAISTFICAWGIQPVMQRAAMQALRRGV
jgi:beta-N-acetylhexosaminidase